MDNPLRLLTPEEINVYHRDGAIRARQVMPHIWIERMAAAVDRIIASPGRFGQQLSNQDRGFTHDVYMHTFDEDFRAFVFESPAALLINQLLRAKTVRFFYDQLFAKEPGSPVPTPWHHDLTFWPIEGQQIGSIWMPLDPVTRASSGVEYIRGSHLWLNRFKTMGNGKDGQAVEIWPQPGLEDVPDIEAHRDKYEIISWDFAPGDVLFFHPCTLHGSSGNASTTQRRRAFASRWLGDDVVFTNAPSTWLFPNTHGLKPGDPVNGPLFPVVLEKKNQHTS
ncbi:MAG: phytanoyl-CoA dioxygenase family protein [Deltaproteobacteria bacterium]|nr:phytanoyl-CoA dioxygenase family protein [Deltaproteobacteria bacterium]